MYQTWEELENSIKNCQKCKLCGTRQNIVFGVGIKIECLLFLVEARGQVDVGGGDHLEEGLES